MSVKEKLVETELCKLALRTHEVTSYYVTSLFIQN
jgi:hypothetical protein